MAFNPSEYMIKLQGRDYLEVKWRIVWFREKHPEGIIETHVDMVGETMIVRATVRNSDTKKMANGLATVRAAGQREQAWSGREIEKAETSAIGRALAHAGFGTQFTGEIEGEYLSDAPVERKQRRVPASSDGNGNSVIEPGIRDRNVAAIEFMYPKDEPGFHRNGTLNKLLEEGVLEPNSLIHTVIWQVLFYRAEADFGLSQADIEEDVIGQSVKEFIAEKGTPERCWEFIRDFVPKHDDILDTGNVHDIDDMPM